MEISLEDQFRFIEKVKIMGPNDCWEWQASKNKLGYGHFRIFGSMKLAHRISWLIFNEKIPEKTLVCHSCDNPSCVNSNHLWLGSNKDNIKDRDLKIRQWQMKKTHCSRYNHPLNGNNLYITPSNSRSCKECVRINKRNYRLKLKEKNA